MPRYDLLIFDFDGTLADSLEEIALSLGRAFQEFGRPAPSLETVSAAIGEGLNSTLLGCAPELDEDEMQRLALSYRRHYSEAADRNTRLYPGVIPLLDRAQAAGIQLAVLSNKDRHSVERGALNLGISDRFEVVIGAVEGRPRKPDPSIFADNIAPHVRDHPKDRILMIGDDVPDLEFARSFGCDAAWARYGFNHPAACEAIAPRYTLSHFAELEAVVFPG